MMIQGRVYKKRRFFRVDISGAPKRLTQSSGLTLETLHWSFTKQIVDYNSES